MEAPPIVLVNRLTAELSAENFRSGEAEVRRASEVGVTFRVLYLSLDSCMRGRMSDAKSYASPVPLDRIMDGEKICAVVKSRYNQIA